MRLTLIGDTEMNHTHQTVLSQIQTNLLNKSATAGSVAELDGRRPLPLEMMCEFVTHVTKILQNLSLEKSDEIAVALPNGSSYTIALLAAMECGIAVPIPPDRLFDEFGKEMRPTAILFSD